MTCDFIPVRELEQRTGYSLKALYKQHATGQGALAPILTKFGGRLGAWREDYDAFKASQRRLPQSERPAA